MNDIYVFIGQGLLTFLACFFAYTLGRSKEKNAAFKEKEKAIQNACSARSSLNNPAVVERLHAKYKR